MKRYLLLLFVGCGANVATPRRAATAAQPAAAAPKHPVDPHAAITARARADAALEQQLPPDYERPFQLKTTDRADIAKLYGEACAYGDKRACIIEAQLIPLDPRGDSYHAVVSNCMAGDQLSCRALPPDDGAPRFPNTPGALSRRVECQKSKFDGGCNLVTLHGDCTKGFAAACAEIVYAVPQQPDSDAMLDQVIELSVHGCRAGIVFECMNVPPGNDRDFLEASRRVCDMRPRECSNLAFIYKHANNPKKERDAWERGCEYGGAWGACIELALGYVDGRLEEPVPGRGQALLEWSCRKLAKLKKTNPFERYPQCTAVYKP